MGTLVDTEISRDYNADASSSNPAADTVVYQLVRVEDDGRLFPATVDEVMKAEHLLEDDKNELSQVETTAHTGKHISDEGVSFKKCDFESSEGLSRSELNAVDLSKLNSKVQEESLPLAQAFSNSSKKEDVDTQLSDHCDHMYVPIGKVNREDNALSKGPNDSIAASLGSGETCSEPVNEAVNNGSLDSKASSCSIPDFSILQGEIHLDSLTIRELQEAFRATFGRQTSVKDKLWLKRRIAMGLTNSCDIPSGNFTIKDNKIVKKDDFKELPCRLQASNLEAVPLPTDKLVVPIDDNCQSSHRSSPANQDEDQQQSSCKRNREIILECDVQSADISEEPCVAKRVRKPTKRYIEELSEFEPRECTGKVFTPSRLSEQCHLSSKSRSRPSHVIGLQSQPSVTRQDSLGGLTVHIPYVCRVRRQRPRKSFMTFMNFVNSESEKKNNENFDINERDVQYGLADNSGDNSDDNAYTTLKGSIKRKHHRSWTLCEVLKLVDGVARFGAGKWSEIKRIAFASYTYRTSVDLKDKWRNLLRASFALRTTEKGAKISRKPSALPIPIPILMRVRELAEMHSKAGIDFTPSTLTDEDSTVLKENETGFL
ncbi:putative transcription factor MYB-HB-like family [Dioscorea sansibarensis]